MRFYPLKFRPILKHRIWGGQKLRELGKEIAEGEKIGESWELADLPEDKSVISNGELAGQALSSVVQKYPKEITGDENFTGPFPLLIKFLDAQDILSVQVHPDEQACERMGKGEPKTECWYIIAAEPGAVIYKGLKKGVTKQQFAETIQEGDVAELLEEVAVEAGQCHFLPAGTAHSIGPGLLIAEIQTPSDTTYRVFDFNRVDDTGKARPLHIEEALESIHFERGGEELSVSTTGRLVDYEYFKVDRGHQAGGCELLLSAGEMKTMIFLTGSGIIESVGQKAVEFKGGDTMLIPYVYEGAIRFTADTQYLMATI
jgi:mannose-6-phosphate isomerase